MPVSPINSPQFTIEELDLLKDYESRIDEFLREHYVGFQTTYNFGEYTEFNIPRKIIDELAKRYTDAGWVAYGGSYRLQWNLYLQEPENSLTKYFRQSDQ